MESNKARIFYSAASLVDREKYRKQVFLAAAELAGPWLRRGVLPSADALPLESSEREG
jgi:hypothetical protein